MGRYILKRYHRSIPAVSAGLLVAEWAIEAATVNDAVSISEKQLLSDFKLPDDFAVLWDENGD